MTALRILSCGPATSIQDCGRRGWQRFGIGPSGAADPMALAAANELVGNTPDTAAIEFCLLGAMIEAVGGPVRLALTGAPMPMSIDASPVFDHTSFVLEPGAKLRIDAARAGVFAILAVEGGFEIAPELGSRSLHARAKLGGFHGRTLTAGDEIPLLLQRPASRGEYCIESLPIALGRPLNVVLGPQDDYFSPAGIDTFLASPYAITMQADRMAYRLSGPQIEHSKGFNIVSDGITAGSIQVPGTGEPIVMLADRQTTGGYPKIATLVSSELRLFVHARAGDKVRFKAVSVEEAQRLSVAAMNDLVALSNRVRPTLDRHLDTDALFSTNVAGAALSAHDPETWHG